MSAVVGVLGAVSGSGAFVGTPIEDAAGGSLSASATLVAPGGPAFSIWSAIYTGLVLYAVFPALPTQRRATRRRTLGWWVAASLLLNAAWILTAQAGSVTGALAALAVVTGTSVIRARQVVGGRS